MKLFLSVMYLLCLAFAGCGRQAKHNQEEAKGATGILLLSRSYGSTYTMILNGEPVNWSEGGANTLVRGFPLHQGTNQVSVNLVFPSGFWLYKNRAPMPDDTYHVFVELDLQETDQGPLTVSNWEKEDSWTDLWPANTPFVWEPEFVVNNQIADPKFDELGTNKTAYVEQCKALSLKLAKLVQKQDYDRLAKVFGLTNRSSMKTGAPAIMVLEHRIPTGSKASLLDNCPALVYQEIYTNEIEVTGISNPSEVTEITGKNLILIHPNMGNHFASFLNTKNKTLLHQWESFSVFDGLKYAGVFNVDCFVFGHCDGKWKFSANGCGWIKNGGGSTANGSAWLDINLSALE